ncbi:MAG: efflux RND transporter permease subunit [gamma proteobacterium symbiont of Bathyaustriella thionipta]|nr:efflux RND transporter permease subunit [gamma proteobacterium symbiont of Bathyaustriella thionipta]MCU7950502.1 efflux RND transporter permease subunit [gamma proteobacterium symbiont of Bathyaustriella thionipta]MCU7954273.1 efflux RND transporter permease subunit [gamma proteobacterium symbiont of Bathyaustriella thionipta]MCU7956994.1 efflux RND transporter permease subunit [gamma proteobacterium symbiont of Bathyaustriella thionipta]MCU7966903.1 efflux RND transporter permease subunit 
MDIAHWAALHRRSILFLVLIVALGGVATGLKLPVSLFPHVDFPRVVVSLETGDQPADQMVIAVTRSVEQAVRSVPGVASLQSTTSRGSAEISINFQWGSNMVSSMLQVSSAINQILPSLPPGTNFSVKRMDPTVFPVVAYSLISDSKSLIDLYDIGEYQLVPLFSSIDGVASVKVIGGKQAEYRVEINPDKMQALKLSFADITQSLSASNVLQAIGRLEDHYKLYLILSDTRIHSLDTIKNTVLRNDSDGFVRLEDIASIFPTTAPQWQRITADGHDAVLVQVYQQPGSNTVKIVDDIQLHLKKYKLPKNVTIANWYDQSQLITESANSVRDAIAIGIVLAAFILLIFLRSLKITLIAILIVPAVLASTILLLNILNMSFNIMTLGGMAAAVGLIVDDAIVMIEHIIRRLREKNKDIALTIREAAIEFTPPLMGSSAATIIIFAPLAFLSGVTGAFFKALSLTMASSLFISFLLAWLAVPLLAEHLLHKSDADKEDKGVIFSKLQEGYMSLMHRIINRPFLLFFGIIPIILIGLFSFKQVGSGFMPHMDEGGFILDYRSESGTSLAETDRLLQQIETILRKNPVVDTYSRRTGAQLGSSLTEANEGDFFVRLKPFPRPGIDEVMDTIRNEIEKKVPGLEIEMALLMEDLIGDLTAVPQPIQIKLFTEHVDELMTISPRVAEAIGKIPGVVDVKDGIVLAGDAINIVVDRDKAALEGIDPDQVTQQLNAWFNGLVTTQVQEDIKLIGVRLWVPPSVRDKSSAINKIWLRATDGHNFPLKRIAHVKTELGQPQIKRDNLKRTVAVTARISGRDLGSTISDIKLSLGQPGLLPVDMYYELGGLYKQQQIAFHGLIAVFIAALALIFVLLLFLYEDFAAALAILVSPLMAMSAVFTGLWITGIELNITAMMGMTMIVGIVTEISIFYFSEYHELLNSGEKKSEALIQAGVNRMRPITMTTLAAILALLPLALALGQGSAMQQPLAVAIISGLMVQIPLVIIVMPVIYKTLSGFKQ